MIVSQVVKLIDYGKVFNFRYNMVFWSYDPINLARRCLYRCGHIAVMVDGTYNCPVCKHNKSFRLSKIRRAAEARKLFYGRSTNHVG